MNRPVLWVLYVILACLTGCAQTPATVVEKISVPTYIPIPATLTIPVQAVLPLGTTWGGGLSIERAALDTCNGNLAAIRVLKPPK